MGTVFGKIIDWLLGKNNREKEGTIFYLKSLLFLILTVILVSDKFWNMSSSIKNLLSEKVFFYIFEISTLCIHFFTSLAIISFVMVIVSAIICEITRKVKCFDKYSNRFNRMRIGAEFRLSYSVEDVLLFLLIVYIFDKNVLQEYISIYSKFIWITLGIICTIRFLTSSMVGVVNRFFMLNPYEQEEK